MTGLRLDLGCGKRASPEGFLRLDRSPDVGANIVCDLDESTRLDHVLRNPVMFPDDSVGEIRAHHILEHLVHVEALLEVLYRLCSPNAVVDVRVPHWQHHSAWDTLDHKRGWTPGIFVNLDRGTPHPATSFEHVFRFSCERLEILDDEEEGGPKEIHAILRAVKP